jgi:hypothetical protein
MGKIIQFIFIYAVLAFFIACNGRVENDPLIAKITKTFEGASGQDVVAEKTWTLWAGNDIDAGTLTVANDGTTLFVTYKTLGTFGNLHLWVGTDISLMPKNEKGLPMNEKFPYFFSASGLNEFTFEIPLEDIPDYKIRGNSLDVVSHAEVLLDGNDENGYGGDFQAKAENMSYRYGKYEVR